jgi:hypothetical protein
MVSAMSAESLHFHLWEDLPRDVQLYCASFLSKNDVKRVCLVNAAHRDLARDVALWRRWYGERYANC